MHQRIAYYDASTHYIKQGGLNNAGMHETTRLIIKKLMEETSVPSERQLAIDCSMSQSTLHRFLKGETETLEFHHLQSIAHHFGLTVSQVIGETPFDPDPKVRVVTMAMQQLPEFKKDVLVAASSALAKSDDGAAAAK